MKKRSNPESEANIRRIDSKPKAKKQTHGFQVHFLRGTDAVSKMFSDTIHGGKEAARRAARKFKRSAMAGLPERVFRGFSMPEQPKPSRTPSRKRTGSSAAKSRPRGARKR